MNKGTKLLSVITAVAKLAMTTGHCMLINLHLNNIDISKGLNSAND